MIELDYTDIIREGGVVATIGNFDGVHRGHQHLISETVIRSTKENTLSLLLTFSPHPSYVFGQEVPLITTEAEKEMLIKRYGIDSCIQWPFTKEFADMSPDAFVDTILSKNIRIRTVIVGEDFRFGKDRIGDFALLHELCKKRNIECVSIKAYLMDDKKEKISSALIRRLIENGDIEEANKLLGYSFLMTGKGKFENDLYVLPLPKEKVKLSDEKEYKGILYFYQHYLLQDLKINSPITFVRKEDEIIITSIEKKSMIKKAKETSDMWLIKAISTK